MRVGPSAIAASMAYRCEIDLSPGRRTAPEMRRAGEILSCMRNPHFRVFRVSGNGTECGRRIPQESAYEATFVVGRLPRRILRLGTDSHHRIVQAQDSGFIEFDGASVLADVTGAIDTARQLLELFRLNRLQGTQADLGRLRDLFKREIFFSPPTGQAQVRTIRTIPFHL